MNKCEKMISTEKNHVAIFAAGADQEEIPRIFGLFETLTNLQMNFENPMRQDCQPLFQFGELKEEQLNQADIRQCAELTIEQLELNGKMSYLFCSNLFAEANINVINIEMPDWVQGGYIFTDEGMYVYVNRKLQEKDRTHLSLLCLFFYIVKDLINTSIDPFKLRMIGETFVCNMLLPRQRMEILKELYGEEFLIDESNYDYISDVENIRKAAWVSRLMEEGMISQSDENMKMLHEYFEQRNFAEHKPPMFNQRFMASLRREIEVNPEVVRQLTEVLGVSEHEIETAFIQQGMHTPILCRGKKSNYH